MVAARKDQQIPGKAGNRIEGKGHVERREVRARVTAQPMRKSASASEALLPPCSVRVRGHVGPRLSQKQKEDLRGQARGGDAPV